MEWYQVMIEILMVVFTGILSIAGIKYIINEIRLYRIRRELQKPKEKQNFTKINKMAIRQRLKQTAKEWLNPEYESSIEKLFAREGFSRKF